MRDIAVLLGGISAEREVSLATGAQVMAALAEAGFAPRAIDVTADLGALVAALTKPRPDVVFNALHGRFGEDGCVQGVLDWLGLPYTHSGVRASALAMDKVAAKTLFSAAGLPVARHREVTAPELEAGDPLPRPYVVKPVNEGSRSVSPSCAMAIIAVPRLPVVGATAASSRRNSSPAAN